MGNPYQPPAEPQPVPSVAIGDKVSFEGNVTPQDVAQLIRVPKILWIMRVFAIVTLVPFALMPIAIFLIDRTKVDGTIPVLAMTLTLGAIFFVADRYISRPRRGARLISKHPGIIGALRGELNALGFTFFNEAAGEFQQITWSAFPEVVVNDFGIRLDWRNEDDAFFAIPQRCIDSYDSAAIRKLVRRFQSEGKEPPCYQSIPDWSKQPDGAIGFQNLVPIFTSTPQQPPWLYALLGVGAIGCAVLFTLELDLMLVLLIMILVTAATYRYGKNANASSPGLAWRQWGWLTPAGCESHVPGTAYSFQWQDPEAMEMEETHVLARFKDESLFHVTPTDLRDGDWSTLIDWITTQRSATSDNQFASNSQAD
jgi:hypothetical protein